MDQDHPFVFRPNTNDEAMFRHLITHDEYRLPSAFHAEDIVVDIGVHIGGFSYLALSRGAGKLYGFEAEPSNYLMAAQNLSSFGDRVRLVNKAVWRSDQPDRQLAFTYSNDQSNTGGGSVIWESKGPPVDTVQLDTIINEITGSDRTRIRLLKIDCEGSEFPILLTSRALDRVDCIVGEFHEYGCPRNPQGIPQGARVPGVNEFTIEVLAQALDRAGFDVIWERHGESSLGLFFADRRPTASLLGRIQAAWKALGRTKPQYSSGAGNP